MGDLATFGMLDDPSKGGSGDLQPGRRDDQSEEELSMNFESSQTVASNVTRI